MKTQFCSLIAFLNRSKKTLLLIVIVAVASVAVSNLIAILLSKVDNLTIPALGNIKTIGVEAYWDPNCENKTEVLDWGTIWISSSTNVTLYIRSISNYKVTLNLNATNWMPANISDYMTLSWDYNETLLNPGEIIPVTLTLSTSFSNSFISYLIANDVKNFNFDISIVASEE
jgi:hypothetical protein